MSKRSDKGWKFREITGNNAFLARLLKKDIFIEEAVDALVLNRRKVDLRIYTFFGRALYVYPRKNHPDRDAVAICQKFNIGYCEECCENAELDKEHPFCYCSSPNVHCKYRPQCIIYYKSKKRSREIKQSKTS